LSDPYIGPGSGALIVCSEFQLILDSRDGTSLYNWRGDPQEAENLFLAPHYQAIGRDLSIELKKDK
jgi:hypothetical protein